MMPAFLVTFFQVKKVTTRQIRNGERMIAKQRYKLIYYIR